MAAGSPHYLSGQAAGLRALIRVATGDVAGALADAEQALAASRSIPDPQVHYLLLPVGAYVLTVAGEHDRARELAEEYITEVGRGSELQFAVVHLPTAAAAARRLALTDELDQALDDRPVTRWIDATRAYLSADYSGAADLLREIGSRPEEAEARLRAAEQLIAAGRRPEGEEQLRLALEFYRSVRATHYVAECEALLAASA